MNRLRLDQELVSRGLVTTRSQAESYIKLGYAQVAGKIVTKPGFFVSEKDLISISVKDQYVSRAALKLASVAQVLKLDFRGKVMLDVGSSTGGFSDYALRQGVSKVIAVEVGTNQLHPTLRDEPRIELHEQTDIRSMRVLSAIPDSGVIDVSFISLQDILPHIARLIDQSTKVIAMVKPQFEAVQGNLKHKGVIKNDKIRREILQHFESWVQKLFIIKAKADSEVSGAKGNRERFYVLEKLNKSSKR